MKRDRFSEEQIIAALREQEAGLARSEVCRDRREIVFDSPRQPNLGGTDIWIATRDSTASP